jgi:uncharacterized protein YbjT (DUF2867 family)
VGREILQGLLADNGVTAVHSLGRRQLPLQHPKLIQHVVDFAHLPPLPQASEVYLAMGTTIKAAGSQQAFRAVDLEANLAVARAARAQGATKLGAISAMGADPRSNLFYSRVKGELEEALTQLGFSTLVFARPSFLTGDREALGQAQRPGEKLALLASRLFAPLIPLRYKSVEASKVARVVLQVMASATGDRILLSDELQATQLAPQR